MDQLRAPLDEIGGACSLMSRWHTRAARTAQIEEAFTPQTEAALLVGVLLEDRLRHAKERGDMRLKLQAQTAELDGAGIRFIATRKGGSSGAALPCEHDRCRMSWYADKHAQSMRVRQ